VFKLEQEIYVKEEVEWNFVAYEAALLPAARAFNAFFHAPATPPHAFFHAPATPPHGIHTRQEPTCRCSYSPVG